MLTATESRRHAELILQFLKPTSQTYKILSHILRLGSITQVEAHELYRVYRLASRITDLKNHNLTFVKTQKVDLTGTRYTEYSLA
jgi:hypothetical protein